MVIVHLPVMCCIWLVKISSCCDISDKTLLLGGLAPRNKEFLWEENVKEGGPGGIWELGDKQSSPPAGEGVRLTVAKLQFVWCWTYLQNKLQSLYSMSLGFC